MRLRRLCLAALASGVSLLAGCAATTPTPASKSTSAPVAAASPDTRVTMSDCEDPPLGSRVSRKCPHGQVKAAQSANTSAGASSPAPAEAAK